MSTKARDENGNPVSRSVHQGSDGTWSSLVWFGSQPATNVQRWYGYKSRRAAYASDISESPAQTNARFSEKAGS